MRPILRFGIAVLFLWPAGLTAQAVTGSIKGVVRRTDSTPATGAEVVVQGPGLQGTRTATVGSEGWFRVLALPVGVYSVMVRHVGERPVLIEGVRVELGKSAFLGTIMLEPSVVDVEQIVVQAKRGLIDMSTAAIGTNLPAAQVEKVPTQRDYISLLTLAPQTTESYTGDPINIGGGTGLENFVYIDGANANDPFINGSSVRLPHNFIQEMQLVTGGYQAADSRALGGLVNVITYSGTNEFQLKAFGYFDNHSLTATENLGLLEATSEGANAYDFGLSVGGPIVRDRLWYFAAYDAAFTNSDVQIPGLGFFPESSTENLFAGKLTWRAGEQSTLVFSFFGDPTTVDRVGGGPFTLPDTLLEAGPYLNRIESGGTTAALSGTHALSDKSLLEGSISYMSRRFYDGPRPGDDEPRYITITPQGSEIMSGGFGEQIDQDLSRFSLRVSASVFAGQHTLKGGVEYEDYATHDRDSTTDPGVILDFGVPGTNECPERWCVIFQDGDAVLRGRVPTVYVQDAWQADERLLLTLGLRWDGQYLLDNHGNVAQSITGQWQPRLGIVYQLGKLGTQKLSASVGRFYETMPLRLLTQSYNDGRINGFELWDTDPRLGGQPLDTLFVFCCSIAPEVPDLKGTHIDEATAAYEGFVSSHVKLGVRGVYRALRDVVQKGINATEESVIGNPGAAPVEFLDPARRDYAALELTLGLLGLRGLDLSASYVLSRTSGNYPGLYDSDARLLFPHENSIYEREIQMPNNDGVLPNDRTHVFKLFGSYTLRSGLAFGTFFTVQTGTPLSRYEQIGFAFRSRFLTPRGSEGRNPTLWDLNLRVVYPFALSHGPEVKLVGDVLHLGNPQTVVLRDQVALLPGGTPNASYGKVLQYQPPMTARVGLELTF